MGHIGLVCSCAVVCVLGPWTVGHVLWALFCGPHTVGLSCGPCAVGPVSGAVGHGPCALGRVLEVTWNLDLWAQMVLDV